MVDENLEEKREELNNLRKQVENDSIRLKGGFSKSVGRKVMSCDEEIGKLNLLIEMKKLELSNDRPLQPKYAFEQNGRWMEIRRGFEMEQLNAFEDQIVRVKDQKNSIVENLEKNKERISELEAELDVVSEEGETDGEANTVSE